MRNKSQWTKVEPLFSGHPLLSCHPLSSGHLTWTSNILHMKPLFSGRLLIILMKVFYCFSPLLSGHPKLNTLGLASSLTTRWESKNPKKRSPRRLSSPWQRHGSCNTMPSFMVFKSLFCYLLSQTASFTPWNSEFQSGKRVKGWRFKKVSEKFPTKPY